MYYLICYDLKVGSSCNLRQRLEKIIRVESIDKA